MRSLGVREADPNIVQYLGRYAAAESAWAQSLSERSDPVEHVLVVPACAERIECLEGYESAIAEASGRVAVIIVLNARQNAAPEVHAANEAFWRSATRGSGSLLESPRGRIWVASRRAAVLVVIDRASPGLRLGDREGVGHARKIGADLALGAQACGWIQSSWIHMTDADAVLPAGYFGAVETARGGVALHPFRHVPEAPELELATALYESWLRYYVLGLGHAGSRYAFHTIGSTISVRSWAYTAVRGVPSRQAAEDFYLLSKLCKVTAIERVGVDPIVLSGRLSTRVPFGTGVGIARALGYLSVGRSLPFYDPRGFNVLQMLLRALRGVRRDRSLAASFDALREAAPSEDVDLAAEVAERQGLEQAVGGLARQSTTDATLTRHVDNWFDGFRTLKFLHALRDAGLPDLEATEALEQAPFLAAAREVNPARPDGVPDACANQPRRNILEWARVLTRLEEERVRCSGTPS